MNNNERFVRKYKQGTVSVMEIWVDRETGVNYLYREDGYSGGRAYGIGGRKRQACGR